MVQLNKSQFLDGFHNQEHLYEAHIEPFILSGHVRRDIIGVGRNPSMNLIVWWVKKYLSDACSSLNSDESCVPSMQNLIPLCSTLKWLSNGRLPHLDWTHVALAMPSRCWRTRTWREQQYVRAILQAWFFLRYPTKIFVIAIKTFVFTSTTISICQSLYSNQTEWIMNEKTTQYKMSIWMCRNRKELQFCAINKTF